MERVGRLGGISPLAPLTRDFSTFNVETYLMQ